MRAFFEMGQHLGWDILPRHFYSEIPDIRVLKKTRHWRSPRTLYGLAGNVDAQTQWTDAVTKSYRGSLSQFEIHKKAVRMNGSDEGYGEVEADFLYCFVRAMRPKRVVQIGCGVSTAVCLLAAEDEGYEPQITCIEPYPTEFIKRESAAGRLKLIAKKVEDVGFEYGNSLGPGDLFFVDSSHTLAPAGEVNLIILEMLPRLAPGVYAHFHDIHFPYDYGYDTLSSALFFQHETALLYAFLLLNDRFEIAASLAMLHHLRIDELVRFFPDMKPCKFEDGLAVESGQYPSSMFLRHRIAEGTESPRPQQHGAN
jgi:hypothetical protein